MFGWFLKPHLILFIFTVIALCVAPFIGFLIFKGSLSALILMITGSINIAILVGGISIAALRGRL